MIKIEHFNGDNLFKDEYEALLLLEKNLYKYQSKKQFYPETEIKFELRSKVIIKDNYIISLNMEGVNLVQVPVEIHNFKHLKDLNLSGNLLYHIPEWIGELSELHILNLGKNLLTFLPKSLQNLIKLESLILSSNNFHQIPVFLNNLSSLSKLDMSYTKVNSLYGIMPRLISLIILDWITEMTEIGNLAFFLPINAIKLIEDTINENDKPITKRISFQKLVLFYQKSKDLILKEIINNNDIGQDQIERLILEILPIDWVRFKSKLPIDRMINARILHQLDFCDFHRDSSFLELKIKNI